MAAARSVTSVLISFALVAMLSGCGNSSGSALVPSPTRALGALAATPVPTQTEGPAVVVPASPQTTADTGITEWVIYVWTHNSDSIVGINAQGGLVWSIQVAELPNGTVAIASHNQTTYYSQSGGTVVVKKAGSGSDQAFLIGLQRDFPNPPSGGPGGPYTQGAGSVRSAAGYVSCAGSALSLVGNVWGALDSGGFSLLSAAGARMLGSILATGSNCGPLIDWNYIACETQATYIRVVCVDGSKPVDCYLVVQIGSSNCNN